MGLAGAGFPRSARRACILPRQRRWAARPGWPCVVPGRPPAVPAALWPPRGQLWPAPGVRIAQTALAPDVVVARPWSSPPFRLSRLIVASPWGQYGAKAWVAQWERWGGHVVRPVRRRRAAGPRSQTTASWPRGPEG